MKRIMTFFAVILVLICSAAPVLAAPIDMDYEGELDIGSDSPITDGVDTAKLRVNIGNDCVYDREAQRYIYSVDNTEVSMNYPDGVITTDYVSFSFPEGLLPTLYRDGKQIDDPNFSSVSDPGKYIVTFNDQDNFSLRFTIVTELTSAITEYRIPTGFAIVSATLDGEDLECDSNRASLTDDGRYDISYRCQETGITHTLSVTVDHTAPVLKLENVVNGEAAGPVDISDAEEGSKVTVLLNDKQLSSPGSTLTESGKYNITISDKAGNVSTYDFMIRVYFNFNSIAFIGIVALVIAAVIAYVIISRRKLRIR